MEDTISSLYLQFTYTTEVNTTVVQRHITTINTTERKLHIIIQ